jgi:hypothetical protein
MTPLDHANATATVSITGLALGCYNKATENYEVGFLRYDCHDLTIEVKKRLPNGDDSIMMYQLKDSRHRIFIDAENAVSPDYPIYTVGEDFDRTRLGADEEDFRWVIDFETDLNGGEPVELRRPTVPVTEMYIEKPRLYADPLLITPAPFVRVRIDPGTNRPVTNEAPEVFGFFTEGIKADITCQDGGAVIFRVEGPQGFHVHLPHGDGPHEITIKNICLLKAGSEEENTSADSDSEEEDISGDADTNGTSVDPTQTDFRLYYSVIRDTDGEKFDLQSPVHGEGAVCNGSTLGQRGSLFPLPASNP